MTYDLIFLTSQHKLLAEFVIESHDGQYREYTNEPYATHPIAVARFLFDHLDEPLLRKTLAIEVALCHDLFEDTDVSRLLLEQKLKDLGYGDVAAWFICDGVYELTNVFTTDAFPYLNRALRKKCEAERLGQINPYYQIVKAADLACNLADMLQHNPPFATTYQSEAREIIRRFSKSMGIQWMLRDSVIFED